MKTQLFQFLLLIGLILTSTAAHAEKQGPGSGGGGDASEIRINEIRADILNWITKDGARQLQLPDNLSLDLYQQRMIDILQKQKVIISFDEQDVLVDGAAKTCRGYISDRDAAPHILCNISRFNNTSEADQYKLIHHEYAGLAQLESNLGAASDYALSSQITSYLKKTIVLKLAILKGAPETINTPASICSAERIINNFVQIETIDREYKRKAGVLSKIFGKKKQTEFFATAHLKDIVIDETRLEAIANYCFPNGNTDGQKLAEAFLEIKNYIEKNSIATMEGCMDWSDEDYETSHCTYPMTSKDALRGIINELVTQFINGESLKINTRHNEFIFNGSNQPKHLVKHM